MGILRLYFTCEILKYLTFSLFLPARFFLVKEILFSFKTPFSRRCVSFLILKRCFKSLFPLFVCLQLTYIFTYSISLFLFFLEQLQHVKKYTCRAEMRSRIHTKEYLSNLILPSAVLPDTFSLKNNWLSEKKNLD